jgi:hypothetical protein
MRRFNLPVGWMGPESWLRLPIGLVEVRFVFGRAGYILHAIQQPEDPMVRAQSSFLGDAAGFVVAHNSRST